jgi:hypothetical protein
MSYGKPHSPQVLTAMQPVIDILEEEYLRATEDWNKTGKYGWMAHVAYKLHTITNFGYYPFSPSQAFTIWN